MNVKELKYGECSKHPGNSLANCPLCASENMDEIVAAIMDIPEAEALINPQYWAGFFHEMKNNYEIAETVVNSIKRYHHHKLSEITEEKIDKAWNKHCGMVINGKVSNRGMLKEMFVYAIKDLLKGER